LIFGHNTKTLSPSVSGNWQNNWTITPISDPQDLANLRALYGLLYRDDFEIAKFIAKTLIFNATKNGNIDFNWIAGRQDFCGISWSPDGGDSMTALLDALERPYGIRITDPVAAMAAYLDALNAFPEATASSAPSSVSYPLSVAALGIPRTSASVSVPASLSPLSPPTVPPSNKPPPPEPCFGKDAPQ
jgi:hypothetical protein